MYFKNYFPNSSNARYVTDALNSDTETDLEKDCILSYSTAKPISGLYKTLQGLMQKNSAAISDRAGIAKI